MTITILVQPHSRTFRQGTGWVATSQDMPTMWADGDTAEDAVNKFKESYELFLTQAIGVSLKFEIQK